jgi:6-phosphofructokinase
LGERAVDLVHNGRFGRMAAIARNEVIDVELREVMGTRKIPLELFEKMRWLFG